MGYSLSPALLVQAALNVVGAAPARIGTEVWGRLADLVAQPVADTADTSDGEPEPPPGLPEFNALSAEPTDETRAIALAQALAERGGRDPWFQHRLEAWGEEVRWRSGGSEAQLDVRAASVHGSLVQSGDLGVNFVTYGPASGVTGSESSADDASSH
jgi:hypothetical protein